jgi:hypothetical protein
MEVGRMNRGSGNRGLRRGLSLGGGEWCSDGVLKTVVGGQQPWRCKDDNGCYGMSKEGDGAEPQKGLDSSPHSLPGLFGT